MISSKLLSKLSAALEARAGLFDEKRQTACRLFNGFYEGYPDLAVDVFARTLVLHNYATPPDNGRELLDAARAYLLERLPWLGTVVVKHRRSESFDAQRGEVVYGSRPDRRVLENGVWYAIDLLLNRDASFFLDTRDLRLWAKANLAGKRVLNTFAYTGSLGVAARAGNAARVFHLDKSRTFLNVAKVSYSINGFPIDRSDFLVGDFFSQVARLKRAGERFGCVFVDPPFFSVTAAGRVDLIHESNRVINKVRPLVDHEGWLVAINNALFVSGQEYMAMLEKLGEGGYLAVEAIIPVPPDITGYAKTIVSQPPSDPAPFNHPTKIAILRIRRKDASPN